jgi:hypothetical protein
MMHPSVPFLALWLGVALTACDRTAAVPPPSQKAASTSRSEPSDQESRMKTTDSKPAKMEWASGPCTGVDQLPKLNGLAIKEIETLLGPAGRKETFLLGERQDELHVAIQNTYPLSKPENAKVSIQEMTWTQGPCKLTVWFHKVKGTWKTFENVRYSATAEF